MYAMDMRQYDPAIGRWVVQDPIVHFNYSPYSAFDNNPVFWADPSGAASIYNSATGQYVINGNVVSFDEALAYADSGGNSKGNNNNEPNDQGKSDSANSLSSDNPMMNAMNPKDDIRKYEKNKKTIERNTVMLNGLKKFTSSGQLESSMQSAIQEWYESTRGVITQSEGEQMLSEIDSALNDLGVEITTAAPMVKIAAAIISVPLMNQNTYLDIQNSMYLAPRILKDSPAYYHKHIMPIPYYNVGGPGPYNMSGGGSVGGW